MSSREVWSLQSTLWGEKARSMPWKLKLRWKPAVFVLLCPIAHVYNGTMSQCPMLHWYHQQFPELMSSPGNLQTHAGWEELIYVQVFFSVQMIGTISSLDTVILTHVFYCIYRTEGCIGKSRPTHHTWAVAEEGRRQLVMFAAFRDYSKAFLMSRTPAPCTCPTLSGSGYREVLWRVNTIDRIPSQSGFR